jgi:hypothetical protein
VRIPGGRRRAAAAVLALASLVPPALVVADIARNGQNVPYMDEWRNVVPLAVKTAAGTVAVSDLFRQQNAHFMLFHNTTSVVLTRLTRWNLKVGMYWTVLLAAALFALAVGAFGRRGYWLWLPFSAIVFSLRQREVWLWAHLDFYPFVAALFLAALLLLRRRPGSRAALAAAAGLSALATVSVASGMVFWPVLFVALPALGYRARADRLLWIAAALVTLAVYFANYRWIRSGVVEDPWFLARFLLAYLGSPLVRQDPSSVGQAQVIAAVAMLVAGGTTLYLRKEGRPEHRPALLPGLALVGMAVACGLFTGAGRGNFGVAQALESRYATHASLFWLGVVALALFTVADARAAAFRGTGRRALAAAGAGTLVFVLARVVVVSDAARRSRPLVTDAHVACMRAFPQARETACLQGLHPRPETLGGLIDDLAAHRLALFAATPPPGVWAAPPPASPAAGRAP